jgi:hypothetical protein
MTRPATILPPSSLARRLVRYILGFSVGIALGLAPFLGRVKVPGFSALLELYPVQMQQNLIILSGFLLGIVAVAVQFYATKASPTAILERYFGSLLKAMLAVLLLLVVLYQTSVVSFPIEKQVSVVPHRVETHRYSVVVGWFRANSAACSCPPAMSAINCVEQHSIDLRMVSACWKYLPLFELALTIPYLFLLGGFGTLVGLLLLKEEEERRLKRGLAAELSSTPTSAAARPKARPSAKTKASPSARPKPSPGPRKRPGTRRGGPPSSPQGPP